MKGDNVFTTGEIADILSVAPRTVAKWIDDGTLRGFRLPGNPKRRIPGQDRRVPRESLLAFMRKHDIPEGPLFAFSRRVLLVGCGPDFVAALRRLLPEFEGWRADAAPTAFDAGAACRAYPPHAAVVDSAMGRREALDLACRLRALEAPPWVCLLCPEDEDPAAAAGEGAADLVFQKPADAAATAAAVRRAVGAAGNGNGKAVRL